MMSRCPKSQIPPTNNHPVRLFMELLLGSPPGAPGSRGTGDQEHRRPGESFLQQLRRTLPVLLHEEVWFHVPCASECRMAQRASISETLRMLQEIILISDREEPPATRPGPTGTGRDRVTVRSTALRARTGRITRKGIWRFQGRRSPRGVEEDHRRRRQQKGRADRHQTHQPREDIRTTNEPTDKPF